MNCGRLAHSARLNIRATLSPAHRLLQWENGEKTGKRERKPGNYEIGGARGTMSHFIPANFFQAKGVRVSEDDPSISEDFPETSKDVAKNSEVLKFYDAFGID